MTMLFATLRIESILMSFNSIKLKIIFFAGFSGDELAVFLNNLGRFLMSQNSQKFI
jgi:hypothetical protein